ncbi:putative phospholipid-binding lipoprotein MlaA precursor [mine drainage metagenome]|uniref:Putative phospholipid-binding lipoprotein MlaA n=1 Tax=mine drainage metagenome TaxID=410659 RepID=A0A1J5SBX8_9ZZZZ
MKKSIATRLTVLLAAALTALQLGGCATSGNPRDPIEGFNRAVFAFNDGVDRAVVKPVAKGYVAVLPLPLRSGISNFFGNIDDVFIAVNDALQGKVPDAINDAGRVMVNTTLGILGFMDVATELGVEKRTQDFGLTLGHWGVGDGAYLVLPFFGPRTVRDTFGLVLDVKADPVSNLPDVPVRNTLEATRAVNERAQLLPSDKIIDEAALDRYAYIRDAYLQHRRSLIYDGNPPRDNAAEIEGAGQLASSPTTGSSIAAAQE